MYAIPQQELSDLAVALVLYYEDARDRAIREKFDEIAQAGMGVVPSAIDGVQAKWQSFRAKERDSFTVTIEAKVRSAAGAYFASPELVADDVLRIVRSKVEELAKQIPVVGTLAEKLTAAAADWTHGKLETAAIARADSQISRTPGAVRKRFNDEAGVSAEVAKALQQFLWIGRYMQNLGKSPEQAMDLMVFPADVFKLQKEVSALNVSLWSISDYVESMQSRLKAAQDAVANYKTTLATKMPEIVNDVLQSAYIAGHTKGKAMLPKPTVTISSHAPVEKTAGGATQLTQYLAHATAMGYYHGANGRAAHDEPLVLEDF